MYWILPVILAAVVLFLTFAYNQNNRPDITAYDLSAPGAPACTVVHLSDLHSKPSARILNETAAQKPDIICITGDYINDKNRNRQKMLDYGRQLVQLAPVLYIPGNHERRLADFDTLMHELSAIGFHVLTDKIETVKGITFLGLDENQASFEAYASARQALFTTGTPLPCLPGWQSTRAIRLCCAIIRRTSPPWQKTITGSMTLTCNCPATPTAGNGSSRGSGRCSPLVRVCAHSTPGAALESGRD